ncbi:MAG TPA: alpha/beta fold hydrolase [Pyrinomonadaceae bacterium]|jgi:pimeloyl-ACP methyl ester carboxylesterase
MLRALLSRTLPRAVAACALLCACAAADGARGQAADGPGFAEVNGTRLYYEARGEGPAVVLVHGGLNDSRLWDDQMGPLARRFRVVRYDLRGFGKSAQPSGQFWPTEDLRALLDFLKIEKATVVGLSLGGIVAADFAFEHPERVERLVFVGAGLRGDRQPPDEKSMAAYRALATGGPEKYFETFLKADLLAGLRERPQARERMRVMMLDNYKALEQLRAGLPQSPEPPTAERLGRINFPALVVVGSLDSKNLLNIADTLARGIPGARKVVIHGASHHPPVETPQEFNRVLLDFLESRKP